MKKKTIIIIVASVLIVALIVGLVCFFVIKNNTENELNIAYDISKLQNIYDNMENKKVYQFSETLNEKNKKMYSINEEKGCIDKYSDGKHTADIIKDGNTYLLVYDTNKYYTYQNNSTELGKINSKLKNALKIDFSIGKEKIDNKTYQYEEYEGYSDFLMKYDQNLDENTAKTKFYFDGDTLVYIKTIYNDKEELLKIDINYDKGDNNLYDIPSTFTES